MLCSNYSQLFPLFLLRHICAHCSSHGSWCTCCPPLERYDIVCRLYATRQVTFVHMRMWKVSCLPIAFGIDIADWWHAWRSKIASAGLSMLYLPYAPENLHSSWFEMQYITLLKHYQYAEPKLNRSNNSVGFTLQCCLGSITLLTWQMQCVTFLVSCNPTTVILPMTWCQAGQPVHPTLIVCHCVQTRLCSLLWQACLLPAWICHCWSTPLASIRWGQLQPSLTLDLLIQALHPIFWPSLRDTVIPFWFGKEVPRHPGLEGWQQKAMKPPKVSEIQHLPHGHHYQFCVVGWTNQLKVYNFWWILCVQVHLPHKSWSLRQVLWFSALICCADLPICRSDGEDACSIKTGDQDLRPGIQSYMQILPQLQSQ